MTAGIAQMLAVFVEVQNWLIRRLTVVLFDDLIGNSFVIKYITRYGDENIRSQSDVVAMIYNLRKKSL